jgi:putative Mn2+ efflux pump MntP
MFNGVKRKLASVAIGSVLKSLATDNRTKTTITGVIAGTIVALGADLDKVIAGDPQEIARIGAGLALMFLGRIATKENADGKATLVGTIAATAYAYSTALTDIVGAVIIAVMGYFTNKSATNDGKPVN